MFYLLAPRFWMLYNRIQMGGGGGGAFFWTVDRLGTRLPIV